MNQTNLIVGIIVVVLVVGGYWLITQRQGLSGETIKIGAIYPLTGPAAPIGEQIKNGAILAVEDINKRGGINGRKIELVIEDGQSDPRASISAFNKLADTQDINLFLTGLSRVALSLIPLADERKVLLMVNASHPEITGTSPFVLRHAVIADESAEILFGSIKDKNFKSIAVLVLNDDYALAFQKAIGSLTKKYSPSTQIIFEDKFNREDTDFKTTILKAMAKNPDAVYIIGFGNPIGVLIKQFRELGYKGVLLSDFGPVLTPDILKIAGDHARGLHYLKLADPLPELGIHYKERFNQDMGNLVMLEYGSIELISKAIEEVGENPTIIVEYIRGLKEFNGSYEKARVTERGDVLPPVVPADIE